jgi:PAS domain S-box-containing protein
METVFDETRTLRRTMRDLVALSALPAVWAGYRPPQVAEGLADVLGSTLHLDLVYIRLPGQTEGQGIEVARTAGGPTPTDQTRDIGRALAPWLNGAGINPVPPLPNPAGPGTVRVVVVPVGCGRPVGVLVAGSRRPAFPSEEDRLLLSVAANQAAAVLQRERDEEALRESEERYRSVIAAMQEGVVLLGADGRIRACNASAERILGLSAEEIRGRTTFDPRWQAVHEDGSAFPGETHPVTVTLRTGRPCSNVVMGVRKPSGELTWVSINSQPLLRGHEPTPHAVVASFSDITERKKTEEALRESEHRWRSLAEALPQLVWTARPDGFMDYGSAQVVQYMGRPASELLGWGWVEMLHPDDRKPTRQAWRAAVAGQSEYEIEHRFRRFDGTYRWFKTRGVAIRDSDGNVYKWFGTCTDITTDKQLEEELRRANARLDLAVRGSNIGIWETDMPDGDVRHGRPYDLNYWERLGYEGPDFPRDFQSGMASVHPDDRAPLEEAMRSYLAGETGKYEVEFRARHRDGSYRWMLKRGVAVRDAGGKPIRFVGSAIDITDRKRAEEALRESEERFRGTFENAAVGIAHTHPTGRFLRVNEKFCAIVGYPRAELLRKTFQDITHPDDLAASLALFAALMRGEAHALAHETRYLRQDGSPVWVELFNSLQRDAAGQPAYAIAVIQDISERKRLDAELRRAKEAAESANRAKDEFLANVSHEIRTPMNAILGMTELALDTPLADDQRQCLRTVRSAADNLLGMIDDLLDFAKIEAGKLELDPADFSLRAAVGDTLHALAVRAHAKGLELIYHVQPDVPDALVGDAGRLRQVLINLVGNAVKFTDQGEVVVSVSSVRARSASDGSAPPVADAPGSASQLCFAVRDTGIGIPQDEQERVFRAFEQEDTSTTRRYGGTGLGLTIAARLVDLMGGRISVDSAPGRGSTFAFTARFGLQPHPPETAAARPPDVLHDLPVLIVDDNATNRRILEEWLRGWQMEPVAVGDGVAAMDALWHGTARGRPYLLVLLDAWMPDANGLALVAKIRQRAELSATRLILLTSGDRPGDLARFRELRVNAHLLKPVQQDELLETIYQVMSGGNGNAPPAARPAGGREQARAPAPAARPLRILVAEDNEFNAQLLEQLLGRRGHRVRLAGNGREALCLAGEGGFDLLLLDVHMPELDGFQVVRAVRERERTAGGHLPVIALTARSRKEDRERCLAAGMDDFLAKPISAADLGAAMDRVVGAGPPAGPPGPGLLDPPVLLAACGGDAAILDRICQAFRAGLPDHLKAVQDGLRDRDAPRLREAAHKLSGMVAAFSTVAGGVASEVEDRAAQGQLEEARGLVGRLETMAEELMRLVGGLSLDALRGQAGGDAEPGRTADP